MIDLGNMNTAEWKAVADAGGVGRMALSPELRDKYNRAAFIDINDMIYRVTVFDEDEEIMYVEHEDNGEQHALDIEELATEVDRFYEIVEIK